jgi:hypothetical protein
MKTVTKRQFVAETLAGLPFQRITAKEVARINEDLIARFGPGGRLSASEIGELAEAAGYEIDVLSLAGFGKDDKYDLEFDHVLKFSDLASARKSILAINVLYQKFKAENDKIGIAKAIEVARQGRQWSLSMSRSKKVNDQKKSEKAEISEWFALWLRTPELFETWVELRIIQLIKTKPEWLKEDQFHS